MPQIRLTTCHSDSLTKELTNAHLLSRDNQVITGKIKIEGDVISIRTSSHTNVALCLLYEVGRAGRLMLQTGILPPREEPYMLSQELARHRIKLFLDMSENWSLFYLSDDHPAIQKWEESRRIFTESLTSTDLNHADELARRALELAINASERLAMAHAHLLLHKRFGKTASSSSTLGVRINPTRFDAPLRDFLEKNINIVSLPMPWNLIEPKEGVYDWEAVDNWVKWIHQSKKFAIAGPLIDFSKKDAIPPWVRKLEHDYPAFRDKCYSHLEQIVSRYGGAISFWNVMSGINMNTEVAITVENMVDLVRTASLLFRQSKNGSKVMIEIVHPFSEFVSTQPNASNASVFLSRLSQEGVKLDALGIQLLLGGESGRTARDLMQLSAKLDEFLHVDFRILVSALGIPSETIEPSYGWWKKGYSLEVQEKWAEHMFAIAMSKPFIDSVVWADLFDHSDMDIPYSGLLSKDGKPKPVLTRLLKMRNRLKKPLGNLELPKRRELDQTEH